MGCANHTQYAAHILQYALAKYAGDPIAMANVLYADCSDDTTLVNYVLMGTNAIVYHQVVSQAACTPQLPSICYGGPMCPLPTTADENLPSVTCDTLENVCLVKCIPQTDVLACELECTVRKNACIETTDRCNACGVAIQMIEDEINSGNDTMAVLVTSLITQQFAESAAADYIRCRFAALLAGNQTKPSVALTLANCAITQLYNDTTAMDTVGCCATHPLELASSECTLASVGPMMLPQALSNASLALLLYVLAGESVLCAPCVVVTESGSQLTLIGSGGLAYTIDESGSDTSCMGIVNLTLWLTDVMVTSGNESYISDSVTVLLTNISQCDTDLHAGTLMHGRINITNTRRCSALSTAADGCTVVRACPPLPSDQLSTSEESGCYDSSLPATSCMTSVCLGREVIPIEITCDDDNACTDDVCNTTTGLCEHIPQTSDLDVPNACYVYVCVDCSHPYVPEGACLSPARTPSATVFWLFNQADAPVTALDPCMAYNCDNTTGIITSTPGPDNVTCSDTYNPCAHVCQSGVCVAVDGSLCGVTQVAASDAATLGSQTAMFMAIAAGVVAGVALLVLLGFGTHKIATASRNSK
jgi:hypothetical protein